MKDFRGTFWTSGGIALAVAVCCFSGVAHAQLAVEMKLEKKVYVSFEPMPAEVTVYNRSGRDVVLGGLGGSSWLRFQVRNYSGELLSSGGKRMAEEPVLVKAGDRVSRTVDLTTYYPVYGYGTYKIQASAFLPPAERYYESPEVMVNVADGKTIWEEVAGPPSGISETAGPRRFSLLTYRGKEKTELYVRITDEETKAVYATYSLGTVILFHRPQAAVDSGGRLNVLYLGAPQVFAHSVVGFDGRLIRREVYKAAGMQRPVLTMVEGGYVQVRGGVSQSPEAKAAAAKAAAGAGSAPVRRLSDRPEIPGLSR